VSTLRDARSAEIRRRLLGTELAAGRQHPGYAAAVRHSFNRLRVGLERAHTRSEAVSDQAWAEYVAGLDRGLDELHQELARAAASQLSGPEVQQVLLVHASALELSGWRLRVSLSGAAGVHAQLLAAEAELDRYRTAGGGPTGPLESAVDDLRTTPQRDAAH